MVRFTFRGMPSRWSLRRAANTWLTHLMTFSPKGTSCQARATRVKNGFQFEVELVTPFGPFKTRALVDENHVDRADGDWQVNAIVEAGDQITRAYQDFLKKHIGTTEDGDVPPSSKVS